jgi:predicted deacylase
LRGQRDVDAALAAADAAALLRFLQGRGVVAGAPGPPPRADGVAMPLAGVARVSAPRAGIVCLTCALGQTVAAGAAVAEIVDPGADPAVAPTVLLSPIAGLVWQHSLARFAQAGDHVVSVAGEKPLTDRRGALLTA